jgi:hypothetical protein
MQQRPGIATGAFTYEVETMTRLIGPLTALTVMATVSAASAGETLGSSKEVSADRRQSAGSESVVRPSAAMPPSPRRANVAPAERHAAEFLRWKDQHANPPR